MPVEATRDLVGLMFLIAFGAFAGLALFLAYSEQVNTGSWRPWPITSGWILVLVFVILALSNLWPGIETFTGAEPLDTGRSWLKLGQVIVVLWYLILWKKGR